MKFSVFVCLAYPYLARSRMGLHRKSVGQILEEHLNLWKHSMKELIVEIKVSEIHQPLIEQDNFPGECKFRHRNYQVGYGGQGSKQKGNLVNSPVVLRCRDENRL